MTALALHEFHQGLGAHFCEVNDKEVVADYGNMLAEHIALRGAAGFLDLGFRCRICLTGADRIRFLHGQVTNDVKGLARDTGCYAALTTAKGKMQSDLNIYRLEDELLLDFEPGLTQIVSERLERYIVADDVQVVDVAPLYGLLTVQGPSADEVLTGLRLCERLPEQPLTLVKASSPDLGEIYLVNRPRLRTQGFDLFVPAAGQAALAASLNQSAAAAGGRACGWQAFETARIEAGIPRFGVDMDETNFPQECGIESRAVSYTKGCYIGQEVLNRIHTLGHVNRELAGMQLVGNLSRLPVKGEKLFLAGKEVGYVTSAVVSPALNAAIALGYVRKEANQVGSELLVRLGNEDWPARIVQLPMC